MELGSESMEASGLGNKTQLWIRIGVLAVFFNIGVAVFLLLGYIPIPSPYNWNLLNWNHFGIIPFFTIPLSIIMAFMLFRRNYQDRQILLAFIGLVVLYSFVFFIVHFEENGNIRFNGLTSLVVLVSSWILSALPFLWNNGRITFSSVENKGKDYALLATGIMWIAPLVAELLVLLNWHLHGVFSENIEHLVIGGNGFNDLLFIPGFATLASIGLYAIVSPRFEAWLSSK